MTELVIEKLVDNGNNKDKMNKTPRTTEYRRRRNETKKLLDLIRGTNNVNNNNIVPVARLVLNNDSVDELDFYVLDKVEKFPDYPFSSLFIDIFVAKLSHNIVNVNINEVKYKCLLLPYQNMYVCIPLLHCWK